MKRWLVLTALMLTACTTSPQRAAVFPGPDPAVATTFRDCQARAGGTAVTLTTQADGSAIVRGRDPEYGRVMFCMGSYLGDHQARELTR